MAALAGRARPGPDGRRAHAGMGDQAYAAFDDAKALEHYQEALKLEPANYEALWKASRAMVDIADVIPVTPATKKSVEEQQKKMYTEATAIAKKAVAANPERHLGPLPVRGRQRQAAPRSSARRSRSTPPRPSGPRSTRLIELDHDQPPRLARPGPLAPADGRDRRHEAGPGQPHLRLHPQGLLRRVRKGPAEGHRAPSRVRQPLPRARPDPRRPQEVRRGRRVLPEGHRPAQDDLQGRRHQGRGQDGARRPGGQEEVEARPPRAPIRKRPGR
ncbi:MAG: hypothetical protein MZV63_64820 [Marinilabiliales bacterium]|nr:hypothetical protein [Marinilabiliales bacterium]